MKNRQLPFVLLLICTAWSACHKDELGSGGPQVNCSFAGTVTDETGQALIGATVSAGGRTTTTDYNGVFRLNNVYVPARNAILHISQAGYFEYSRAWIVQNGAMQTVRVQLLEKTIRKLIYNSDAAEVEVGKAFLRFPDRAVVAADGSAYYGPVAVSARYLDPTTPELPNRMPGDLRGIRTDGEEQVLATFGMMVAELSMPDGTPLKIAPGKSVEIRMPIPAEKQTAAPAEIPLWYYDPETARWLEEGSARRTGDAYVGQVRHFSWWNCDYPLPIVQLSGKVFAGHPDNPLQHALVRLTELSTGFQGYTYSNDRGWFGGAVPKGEAFKLEILVDDQCGGLVLYSREISPFSADTDLPDILVPVENDAFVDVTGRLTDCAGQGVENGYVQIKIGAITFMVPTIWDGSFSGTLVVCNPDQIKIIGYDPNQLKESEPLAIQNYEGHELPVGVLQVCTELTGYMQLDLGGTEFLFRRNIHASYSGGSTFIDGNEYPEKVDLTFQNDGQTGTFPAEYFKLAPLPDSVRSSDIKVNVLRFDAGPGGRVTGEIQGSLYYLSGQTVPLSGRFNLNRQ